MINGEALPSLDLPTPSSSFDEQGRFKSAVELPGKTLVNFILFYKHTFHFA